MINKNLLPSGFRDDLFPLAEQEHLYKNKIISIFSVNGYSFCFLDDDQNEILKSKHLENDKRKKEKYNRQFAAYFIEDNNYENPKVFDTTKELAETLNVNQSKIPGVCRGERSHTSGWRIAYFNRENNQPELTETHRKPVKKLIRKQNM